jgi:predicted dinucleotide-binding enzyme
MRVCICGGGNAAHVMASHMGARADLWVGVFAPFQDEAQRFRDGLSASEDGVQCHSRGEVTWGKPDVVSAMAEDVVPDADVILIPLPSFAHVSTLQAIGQYLKDGCVIVALPGQGGFNWVARHTLGQQTAERIVIGGTNQLPYQCRTIKYGSEVDLIGHKRNIKVATEPSEQAGRVADVLTDLIGVTQVDPLPNFMTVTLTPANQVIHPTIMYGLFHDYKEPLSEAPLFYQNTDEFTADIMTQTSDEVLAIAQQVAELSGQHIPVPGLDDMMREMYADELEDPTTMKSIFCTNRGYQNLLAPMVKSSDGRLAPDFNYRYLTEDIPRGQCVLKGVAQIAGVATPTIDRLIRWAGSVMGKEYVTAEGRLNADMLAETAAPQAFGFNTIESIM